MNAAAIEVLLVESQQDDVDLTLNTLRQENLAQHIHVARDGQEALDFIFCRGEFSGRSFEDSPLLILVNMKLPEVDGLEVLRQLKSDPRTKILPVVMLISSGQERDLLNTYSLGANGCIQKFADRSRFRESVRRTGFYWLVTSQPPVPVTRERRQGA